MSAEPGGRTFGLSMLIVLIQLLAAIAIKPLTEN